MSNFFDTNVIIYLTSRDADHADVSERLLQTGGTISVQILNETVNVLRRKAGFTWDEVREFVSEVRTQCQVVPLSVATHERGLAYAERYQLGVYDAMIVAAAVLAGCTTLYSEDMHNGLIIDGLTIRNPCVAV